MKSAVEIRKLTKDFPLGESGKRLRAVDSLTLDIEEGEIFGLLGPNGSGKSTTIKALLGLLEPSEGECRLYGVDCRSIEARRHVGYLPEAPFFQRFLTGTELLVYFGKLCGLRRAEAKIRAIGLLEKVGLADAGNRRIAGYSKGMLQRIGLAQALIGDPKLIILDEPTAGVDPVGAADIARMITDLKGEGKTVILCSHLLAQVEQVCGRVAILRKGKRVAYGRLDELLADANDQRIQISGIPESSVERIREIVSGCGGSVESAPRKKSLDELFIEISKEDER